MANRIYLCLAHMSEAGWEQKYIQEAFDTNWVVPLGPNVNGFEEDLRQYVCQMPDSQPALDREIVALSSGTAAVHLGLLACGVGPGDEVLVQSFTFCASTHPIKYLGATPIMIDSETETWNMDPELLEEAICDRIVQTGRKPKAIVPVYLYGMPAKIDEIMDIARRYLTFGFLIFSTISLATFSDLISGFFPLTFDNSAVYFLPSCSKSADIVQNSSGLKASINSSRSQIILSATL